MIDIEEAEVNCEYTDEITCPWCGYTMTDSWELSDDGGYYECYDCDKDFAYTRNIEVTYSTSKVTKEICPICGKLEVLETQIYPKPAKVKEYESGVCKRCYYKLMVEEMENEHKS